MQEGYGEAVTHGPILIGGEFKCGDIVEFDELKPMINVHQTYYRACDPALFRGQSVLKTKESRARALAQLARPTNKHFKMWYKHGDIKKGERSFLDSGSLRKFVEDLIGVYQEEQLFRWLRGEELTADSSDQQE